MKKPTGIISAAIASLLLHAPPVLAGGGLMTELRVGADLGEWGALPVGSVRLGWRLAERWSVGIEYAPLRFLEYQMLTGNDTSSSPIIQSAISGVCDYRYRTHESWGGRLGVHLGVLSPSLGVADPGDDMSGGVFEGTADLTYGRTGEHLSVEWFVSLGGRFGTVNNNTHEMPMTGSGPVIVDKVRIADPVVLTGLSVGIR